MMGSPLDVGLALALAVLAVCSLVWLPASLQMRRDARRPVHRLEARAIGYAPERTSVRLVPTDVRVRVPFGTDVSYGAMCYRLSSPTGEHVEFEAPQGLKMSSGQEIVLELDAVTHHLVAVANEDLGCAWDIPRTIPGPISPLAPGAVLIAAVVTPFALLGAAATTISELFVRRASTSMGMLADIAGTRADVGDLAALESQAGSLSASAAPWFLLPAAISLAASFMLCRREQLELAPPRLAR